MQTKNVSEKSKIGSQQKKTRTTYTWQVGWTVAKCIRRFYQLKSLACMEEAVSASADTFVFENMSVAISVFRSIDITCERGLAISKTKAGAPFSFPFIPLSLIFHSSPPFSTPPSRLRSMVKPATFLSLAAGDHRCPPAQEPGGS